MRRFLKEEISRTHRKVKTVYGKEGEAVYVISERDDILIVENIKGERFSIHKSKVYLT